VKVKILRSATDDLVEGYRFYEQCSPGVGAYFIDSLYSDIDSLVITAGMHRKVFGDYHQMLSKRFPFAVYYRISGNIARVYAVIDCRKNPAWIRQRLSK
jgi:hypothetical protein